MKKISYLILFFFLGVLLYRRLLRSIGLGKANVLEAEGIV